MGKIAAGWGEFQEDWDNFVRSHGQGDGESGNKGEYIGDYNNLTSAEKKVVDELVSQGKTVERIQEDPNNKTPDFKVDGVKTELKTLENANTNTGMKRIQQAFQQGAETVIIDARNSGLTQSQANEILNRTKGKYPDKLIPGKVEIWLDNLIVTYP